MSNFIRSNSRRQAVNFYRFVFQSSKMYNKTAKYEYSTASSGSYNNERGNFNEINKLDTLLSDLEHERTATLDRSTIDSFLGPNYFMNESHDRVPIFTSELHRISDTFGRRTIFRLPDGFYRFVYPSRDDYTDEKCLLLFLFNSSILLWKWKSNLKITFWISHNFPQTNARLPTILASIQVYCEYGIRNKFS